MTSAENEKDFYDFGGWLLPVQDVPFSHEWVTLLGLGEGNSLGMLCTPCPRQSCCLQEPPCVEQPGGWQEGVPMGRAWGGQQGARGSGQLQLCLF